MIFEHRTNLLVVSPAGNLSSSGAYARKDFAVRSFSSYRQILKYRRMQLLGLPHLIGKCRPYTDGYSHRTPKIGIVLAVVYAVIYYSYT